MNLRRGFSSPGFEQGMQSEFDQAVEVVAKAMWESEPVIYAWGPQERHMVSWDDAVARGLAGVSIFRKFACVAVEALRSHLEGA